MTVAKTIEISSTSTTSFDDAVSAGIASASNTVKNIKSAWVKDQSVSVENGAVTEWRVNLKVTFVVE